MSEKNTIAEIRYCRDCRIGYLLTDATEIIQLSYCPKCRAAMNLAPKKATDTHKETK
jgi:predicted Zn-ribbon and HTH transcriptional regulator